MLTHFQLNYVRDIIYYLCLFIETLLSSKLNFNDESLCRITVNSLELIHRILFLSPEL